MRRVVLAVAIVLAGCSTATPTPVPTPTATPTPRPVTRADENAGGPLAADVLANLRADFASAPWYPYVLRADGSLAVRVIGTVVHAEGIPADLAAQACRDIASAFHDAQGGRLYLTGAVIEADGRQVAACGA